MAGLSECAGSTVVGAVLDSHMVTLGESFKPFEELEAEVEKYKKSHFVELWKRDAKTIAAARRKGIVHPIHASLRYHDI